MSMKKYWKFDVHSKSDVIHALNNAAEYGDITYNGFPFKSCITSKDGGSFNLYVPYITGKNIEENRKDIDRAVCYLRYWIGDVIGKIRVVMVESDIYLHQFLEKKSYRPTYMFIPSEKTIAEQDPGFFKILKAI